MGALPEQGQHASLVSIGRTLARALLDALPDPAWVKDTAGRYVAVNPAYRQAYERLTQRSLGEIIGRTDFDLFTREQAETARQQESEIIAARGAHKAQQCLPDSNGKLHRFQVHRIALIDEAGNVEGTVGFAQHLRDQTGGDAELRARADELKTLVANLPGM